MHTRYKHAGNKQTSNELHRNGKKERFRLANVKANPSDPVREREQSGADRQDILIAEEREPASAEGIAAKSD
jgi:hypothetical protein